LRIRHVALAQILKNKQRVRLHTLATMWRNIHSILPKATQHREEQTSSQQTNKPTTNIVDSSKSNKTLGVDWLASWLDGWLTE